MNEALCEELPYWEFGEKPCAHIVLWDGSVAAGIELSPLDVECFDESQINWLTEGLRAFANTLPEHLSVQFLMRTERDFNNLLQNHRKLFKTDIPILLTQEERRVASIRAEIESNRIRQVKLYLFFKTDAAVKPKFFSGAQKKFSKEFQQGFDQRMQTLTQTLNSAQSQLQALGFETKEMGRDILVSVIYEHLNPRRKQMVGAPDVHDSTDPDLHQSPREQLALSDVLIEESGFVLDQTKVMVLTLKTLPQVTWASMMRGILDFPFHFELVFSLKVPDQTKEMKGLEQKRRLAFGLTANPGNRVSDLEGESRLQQTTDLISEIINTGQKIFQAEMVVILRSENSACGERELKSMAKEVLARFRKLSGAEAMEETVASWKVFSNELPGAPLKFTRAKKLKCNNLADFLPVYGVPPTNEIPFALTYTRSGSLCALDPYDPNLTNYNWLVTGSSGSGKSFASNFLLLQQLARGLRVFIIDIGGSYKKMTELLGGQYFEMTLDDKYAINPFDITGPEKTKSLVNILELMVTDDGEKISRLERSQIEEALNELLANRGAIPPTLSDFANHCAISGSENLKNIGQLLKPWTGESTFARLLDRQGRLQTTAPIVTFDLKGLSQYPDLQGVMILILTNFILEQVESAPGHKRVLLDEAWHLLKTPAASQFMEYAARTFRKTGSGITFLTQGLDEITQSPIGSAILNNTATKLVMMQKGDLGKLQAELGLNSQELRLISSLRQEKGVFSEGFLISGARRRVVRIAPSPLDYWISTSDAQDNAFLEDLKRTSTSLEEALLKASELAPQGVAMRGRK